MRKLTDYPAYEQQAFNETVEQYRNATNSEKFEMRYYLNELIEDNPDDVIYELCLKQFNKIDR